MQTTRLFKNGNSQAVRIPASLAYPQMDATLEIERVGDEIRLRPIQRNLGNVMDIFASFSKDFMKNGRESHAQKPRDSF